MPKAKKSTNIFQFLDDICAINLYSEFGKNFKKTQNQHWERKNLIASFLNSDINANHREFKTDHFDERNATPFSTCLYY